MTRHLAHGTILNAARTKPDEFAIRLDGTNYQGTLLSVTGFLNQHDALELAIELLGFAQSVAREKTT